MSIATFQPACRPNSCTLSRIKLWFYYGQPIFLRHVEADVTWVGKGLVQGSDHQILFYFFTSATTKQRTLRIWPIWDLILFGYLVLIHIHIAQAN